MTPFGILNTHKPPGCTSRAVVDHVERVCGPAKVGHAGTLDPLATGVLVICVGQATRLIKYVQQMRKLYDATFLLGHASETDDIEGQVTVLDSAPQPTREAIESALIQFQGTIQQRPPAYSAVKVAGRRAYQLARRGADVELAPRSIIVHRLHILRYSYPELQLQIECSSGTYVRALGRDLAAELGTTAVMSALVRTSVGVYRLKDAVSLCELTAESILQHLQTPLAAVADLPQVVLDDGDVTEICHGRPIDPSLRNIESGSNARQAEWAAVDSSGQLVAILQRKRNNRLWPILNFYRPVQN
jgi:tRNA pseudouridine55 synthase